MSRPFFKNFSGYRSAQESGTKPQLCATVLSLKLALSIYLDKDKNLWGMSFSFTCPTLWHSLPYDVRHSLSSSSSKTALKSPQGLTFMWWGCCGLCLSHKSTELAHSFSVFLFCSSVSVFMALSTVFHSINSPDNSPLSHSVLLVFFLPYWFFQLYISSKKKNLSLPQP